VTADIELDAVDLPGRDAYFLLTALVVPRPIAWVSTQSAAGVRNLAPHSFFTVAANDPPHVLFSSTALRDTVTNIRQTGEFVVNVVSADLVTPMNESSAEFAPETDEFERVGVTPVPSASHRRASRRPGRTSSAGQSRSSRWATRSSSSVGSSTFTSRDPCSPEGASTPRCSTRSPDSRARATPSSAVSSRCHDPRGPPSDQRRSNTMLVGIEGRGTLFTALIADDSGATVARATVPATTPEETLDRVIDFVRDSVGAASIDAAGIACFGPLDLERGLVTYTLKPGWQGYPLVDHVSTALGAPTVIDTDVNAAALAEGTARGVENLLFITIGTGTGIGAGALAEGRPLHGASHPEMGHLPVTRHPDDPFDSRCPYHPACLEGFATSKAMVERWGVPVEDAPLEAVRLEAWYLAQLVTAATYMLSPEVIVVDGGVAALPGLLEALRDETRIRLSTDPAVAAITADIDAYIQLSVLEGDAAALGALALAASIR
jgi:fructokinase